MLSPMCTGGYRLTDRLIFEQVPDLLQSRVKSEMVTDQDLASSSPNGFDKLRNLFHGVRNRFFQQDMAPHPGSLDGDIHVQACWIGNDHCIGMVGKGGIQCALYRETLQVSIM